MSKKFFSKFKLVIACLVVSLLAGCANLKNKHLFDNSVDVEATLKQLNPPPSGLASVYLISNKTPLQELSLAPASSFAFVVDNRIVTQAPRGSFVHLLFQPGRYKIGVMYVNAGTLLSKANISSIRSLTFEPNKTYIFDTKIVFQGGFHLDDPTFENGRQLIQSYKLAKTTSIPISIEAFERKQEQKLSEKAFKEAEAERQQQASEIERAQTTEGISDFFASAASVALVALFLVGFGIAMSPGQPAYALPPMDISSPSAYVSRSSTVQSASGKTMQLETTKSTQSTSINNLSTGVRYHLDGDKFVGTDGSWYRVAGNTIYTNTGSYYTRSGNVLTSNDGRQCQIIGAMINCSK